jgi:hypothetical protein
MYWSSSVCDFCLVESRTPGGISLSFVNTHILPGYGQPARSCRGWPTSRGLSARVTANLSPESVTASRPTRELLQRVTHVTGSFCQGNGQPLFWECDRPLDQPASSCLWFVKRVAHVTAYPPSSGTSYCLKCRKCSVGIFFSSYFMVIKHKYKSMYSIPLVYRCKNKNCFKRKMLGEFQENVPPVPFPSYLPGYWIVLLVGIFLTN